MRLSVIVLMLYAGLLVLTYWQFTHAPSGFIPQQDKGYLLLNVQLPDSASVERTQRVMARIETLARSMPGVEHTVGVSGQSLLLNANAPNLGSMYIMLKEFAHRRGPKLTADAIAAELTARQGRREVRAIVSAFGAPPIDGSKAPNPSAASSSSSRIAAILGWITCNKSAIRSWSGAMKRLASKASSIVLAPTLRGCISRSTGPSAWRSGCR